MENRIGNVLSTQLKKNLPRFKHIPAKFDFEGQLDRETGPDGRLYSTPSGKKYPSVTTVLSSGSKEGLENWRKRVGEDEAKRVGHHASVRGTKVHDLMESYVRGDNIDESKLMPHYKKSLHDLSAIMDERLTEWYSMEQMMWSDYLGIAGQMDLAGRFDGVRSVIDYKTSLRVKQKTWITNYFIQETAYSIMFEERTGISLPNLVIVMDVDNHKPIIFKEHRDNWVKPLMEAIEAYHKG